MPACCLRGRRDQHAEVFDELSSVVAFSLLMYGIYKRLELHLHSDAVN